MENIFLILRYCVLLLVSALLASLLPKYATDLYEAFFPEKAGGFGMNFTGVEAMFIATLTSFALLTVLFGKDFRTHVHVRVLLILTVAFGILCYFEYFYVPIFAIFVGATLGLLLRVVFTKIAYTMRLFENWRKYF